MAKDKMYVGGDMREYWNGVSTRTSAIIAIITAFVISLTLIVASVVETRYDTTAEVLSVDSAETLFVDGAGYVWSVYDTNYRKGQFVKLSFNNNRTDYTRNDDIITKVTVLDN